MTTTRKPYPAPKPGTILPNGAKVLKAKEEGDPIIPEGMIPSGE